MTPVILWTSSKKKSCNYSIREYKKKKKKKKKNLFYEFSPFLSSIDSIFSRFYSSHSVPLFIKINRIRLTPKNGEIHGIIHHRTIPAIESFPAALFLCHHFREISDRVRDHRFQEVKGGGSSDGILVHAKLEIPEGQDLPERPGAFG